MTATSYTDWTVRCDHPGCHESHCTGTDMNMRDGSTASDLRKILKRQGWTLKVIAGRVRDFCPEHKEAGK